MVLVRLFEGGSCHNFGLFYHQHHLEDERGDEQTTICVHSLRRDNYEIDCEIRQTFRIVQAQAPFFRLLLISFIGVIFLYFSVVWRRWQSFLYLKQTESGTCSRARDRCFFFSISNVLGFFITRRL